MHGSLADVTRLEAPGIAEECRWIEAWWQTGRPYFGICHGLQLAAQMLGEAVGPPEHRQAEFGYYPLISHAPGLIPDGLQCHAELSLDDQQFLRASDPQGMTRPCAQDAATQAEMTARHFEPMRNWMQGFLQHWLAGAQSG